MSHNTVFLFSHVNTVLLISQATVLLVSSTTVFLVLQNTVLIVPPNSYKFKTEQVHHKNFIVKVPLACCKCIGPLPQYRNPKDALVIKNFACTLFCSLVILPDSVQGV